MFLTRSGGSNCLRCGGWPGWPPGFRPVGCSGAPASARRAGWPRAAGTNSSNWYRAAPTNREPEPPTRQHAVPRAAMRASRSRHPGQAGTSIPTAQQLRLRWAAPVFRKNRERLPIFFLLCPSPHLFARGEGDIVNVRHEAVTCCCVARRSRDATCRSAGSFLLGPASQVTARSTAIVSGSRR